MACTSTPPRRPSKTVSPPEGGEFHVGGAVSAVRHCHYGPGVPIDLPGTRRGHQSFREALQTPVCTHPIKGRLRMHTTMVRNAALWAGQAWPITETLLKAVNSTQLRHIRTMLGGQASGRSLGGLEPAHSAPSQGVVAPVGEASVEYVSAGTDVGALRIWPVSGGGGRHAQVEN